MLIDGPKAHARATVVLAHGAGAPMDTPYMTTIAAGLAAAHLRVVRFEFAYMARRREDGKRRGPDRMPVLLQRWTEVLDGLDALGPMDAPVFIGGKSMGGRSAAIYAADPDNQDRISGVVCLGYPFHLPGKPEKTRLEPLRDAVKPTLILHGERDPFGKPDEVASYRIEPPVQVRWIPDGDHSFVPRKRSGYTEDQTLDLAVTAVTDFVSDVLTGSRA